MNNFDLWAIGGGIVLVIVLVVGLVAAQENRITAPVVIACTPTGQGYIIYKYDPARPLSAEDSLHFCGPTEEVAPNAPQ